MKYMNKVSIVRSGCYYSGFSSSFKNLRKANDNEHYCTHIYDCGESVGFRLCYL
jgi:hypothetical protein